MTRRAAAILIVLATLGGCSLSPVYTGSRTVTLKVATPLGATSGGRGMLGANLETLRVEVTGADFAKVDTVLTPTSPGVYDAKVTVPVGKGRTFTVTARDAGGKGYATGTTVADLTQPLATVAVTLAPVTAGAPVVTASTYTADFTGLATGEVARVVFEPVVATTQGFQASLTDAALAVVNAAGAVVARGSSGWTMTSGGSVVLLYTKTGAAPALSVATMAGTPVLYYANGADGGSVPVDPALYVDGQSVTVLGAGTLVKAGYYLAGWMTAADGSGTSYSPAVTITKPSGPLILHALWVPTGLIITSGSPFVITGLDPGFTGALVVPPGITEIANNAFSGRTGLTSVVLPPGVEAIPYDAFSGCTALTTVSVPPTLRDIRVNAFNGCTALSSFTFPSGLGYIGVSAFQNSGLTSVTLPPSVVSLGAVAFMGCHNLKTLTLSSPVAIPLDFCNSCSSLESVTLPEGITSLGGRAFWGTKLTSVTLPTTLKTIQPEAFFNCTSLTSVTFNEGLTSIQTKAFEYSGLTSVSLPSTLTSVASFAFSNCPSLATVSIASGALATTSFVSNPALTSVSLGPGVTSVGPSAFTGCTNLATLTIQPGLTSIGSDAFSANKLTSVVLPATVTSVGTSAFEGCTSLASVTVKSGAIGTSAFAGATALTNLTLENGVTSIGSNAFDGVAITSINLPSTVTTVGGLAFTSPNLTSVTMAAGTPVASAFSGPITSVTLGAGVTSVGANAFNNLDSLTTLTLSEGLTAIGNYAFNGSSLTSVTLPSTVTNLGSLAFGNTPTLSSVVLLSTTPPTVAADTFDGAVPGLLIHVPSGSLPDYLTAWSGYAANLVSP